MDAAHKEKLAQGRSDARQVKAYLEFLETNKPRRGRRRTVESVQNRLAVVGEELASPKTSALARLNLFQEQVDLHQEIEQLDTQVDGEPLRLAFVEVAARYATNKGIERAAFRAMGVDAATLKQAGI